MLRALPLGRLLVTSGLLSPEALETVLDAQKADGRRLGELLAERGLVPAHQLAQFLSHQLSCPWVSLQRIDIAPSVIDLLPRHVALAHHVVPVHLRSSKGEHTLYIATDDPTDEVAIAECSRAVGMPVKPMVALASEIRGVLERLYGATPRPAAVAPAPSEAPPRRDTLALPKPPLPPRRTDSPPPLPVAAKVPVNELDSVEIVDGPDTDRPPPPDAAPSILPARAPRILVLSAPDRFRQQVEAATIALGASIVDGELMLAPSLVSEHRPCAIVVTDDVYAFERSGLNKLALESDAILVVWSDDVEGKQLEPLLEGAVKRWRRSSYAKGTVLEGRYELLRDLGGACPGSRWEVRHPRTGRRSKLKVGVRTPSDESDAQAVRREEAALSRVSHPGAVDLRDAGSTELGDPFIVVEMSEGRTLEGLVAARGALFVDDACAIVRELAETLSAAHAAGVVHRDVKPENVLLIRDGYGSERVKLLHWESATVTDDEVDPKPDLVGLGECAFLALYGRVRTEGDAIPTDELGEELAALVSRALGLLAGYTYGSMRELIVEIDEAVPSARERIRLLEARPERRVSIPPQPKSDPAAAGIATPSSAPPEAPAPVEQRRHARAPYRTPVRVEVPGIGAVDGRSEDISVGGLFIVTKTPIAVGTEITIRFALPIDGKVVSETGIVKWTRSTKEGDTGSPLAVGVELVSSGTESRKQIERYVTLMSDGS